MQHAGTLANLKVFISVAPGAGNSWTITARKNGASTTVTCTIANPNTTCSDTTHTAAFAVGDTINVLIVGTSAPTTARMTWVANFS